MHTKNEQLIRKLISKSESGDIRWSITEVANQYILHISEKMIVVTKSSSMGNSRVIFEIKNDDGSIIDSMSKVLGSSASRDAELLSALYDAARRNAKRINEAIDSLLSELD